MAGQARRVVVHLGLQKTGSTSLHHVLGLNRLALAGRMTALMPERGSGLRRLGMAAMAFSLSPDPANAAALRAELAKVRDTLLSAEGAALLVSHENLCGAMPGRAPTGTPYLALERILSLCDEGLAPLRPHYVITLRDPDGWKRSVWAQAVRSDGYDRPLSVFMAEMAGLAGWDGLLARAASVVGADRLTALKVEETRDLLRPADRLLALLGLDQSEIAALAPLPKLGKTRVNEGALEFLWKANGLGLGAKARQRLSELVVQEQALFVQESRLWGLS